MPTRKFAGRLTNLDKICHFITRCAHQAGLDEGQVYAVQLAVDEAATNIIEHGYGGAERGYLILTCELLADGLKVVIHDQAPPFDPGEVPEPVAGVLLEELKPRGLGVFLMHKMMDEVQHEFKPGYGNTLTMIKRKKPG